MWNTPQTRTIQDDLNTETTIVPRLGGGEHGDQAWRLFTCTPLRQQCNTEV